MKIKLLFLIALMSIGLVNAKNGNKLVHKIGVNSRFNDAVTFVERGIKFYVFLNGDFDFNTPHNNYYDNDRYNRYRRNDVNIERDRNGRIRRVGNVFVNYNYKGSVSRIGNVFIRYKFGNLAKVGHLSVNYDRYGNPYFRGFVKRGGYYNNYNSNSCDVTINVYDYNDRFFYRNDFRRNYRKYREDNDFYYYRALHNTTIGKYGREFKRRKQSVKRKTYKREAPIKGYQKKEKGDDSSYYKRRS